MLEFRYTQREEHEMPMKNRGSVPRGKKEKKASNKQAKSDQGELKGIRARVTDQKPGKNDPRRTGK